MKELIFLTALIVAGILVGGFIDVFLTPAGA